MLFNATKIQNFCVFSKDFCRFFHAFLPVFCRFLPLFAILLPPATCLPPPRITSKQRTSKRLVAEWQIKMKFIHARATDFDHRSISAETPKDELGGVLLYRIYQLLIDDKNSLG